MSLFGMLKKNLKKNPKIFGDKNKKVLSLQSVSLKKRMFTGKLSKALPAAYIAGFATTILLN